MTPSQAVELIAVLKRVADAMEVQNSLSAKALGNVLHDPECWRSGCYNSDHATIY